MGEEIRIGEALIRDIQVVGGRDFLGCRHDRHAKRLTRRLLALMLLHRFSDPVRSIRIEGWQNKAADLGELRDLLWPI